MILRSISNFQKKNMVIPDFWLIRQSLNHIVLYLGV